MPCPSGIQESEENWYTLTRPLSVPPASFFVAPTANIVPSPDKDTELPKLSPSASPSMSCPSGIQESEENWYTLTWPVCDTFPLPTLKWDPIATTFPSFDKDTAVPLTSSLASPYISCPSGIQEPEENWYNLTPPLFSPPPLKSGTPMANLVPSPDKDTT